MKRQWTDTVIKSIAIAVYVSPNMGSSVHKDRPFHGFVLNDAESARDYLFSDGSVLNTNSNELFYLPKGSTYNVRTVRTGGCYAINFDADIIDEPFSVAVKNPDSLRKSFRYAALEWRVQSGLKQVAAMRAVYDSIYHASKEGDRLFGGAVRESVLTPAVDIIKRDFTSSDLTVASLADNCGISEVYFRRLFLREFGLSPKEFIIGKRMEYARELLESGYLSVGDVGALCGYEEPCHFSREFKRYFGVSPTNYRGKQKN